MSGSQPWSPADATTFINKIALNKTCDVAITAHAKERMNERSLIMSDVLFVLKNGYVYEEPEPSTLDSFFKYKVESQSPNSGTRTLRVVAIPDEKSCQLKIVTIMWRDEK
ncbi:DUF4258 domain-containing protein [uncultured Tateyamaria sp.]|uniref:DUF4258 domain-containing protein n=1 Tax=uncultured Tateyamaria sp. TaxID=455651 RepID=UPI003459F43E